MSFFLSLIKVFPNEELMTIISWSCISLEAPTTPYPLPRPVKRISSRKTMEEVTWMDLLYMYTPINTL